MVRNQLPAQVVKEDSSVFAGTKTCTNIHHCNKTIKLRDRPFICTPNSLQETMSFRRTNLVARFPSSNDPSSPPVDEQLQLATVGNSKSPRCGRAAARFAAMIADKPTNTMHRVDLKSSAMIGLNQARMCDRLGGFLLTDLAARG